HAAWNPVHSIEIHWATLHGIHCIQLGSIVPRCMEFTAINQNPLHHTAWNPLHSIEIDPFNPAAWNALRSIGMHFTMLHGIHCIQSGCILPRCMEYTAFNHNAWNPPHQLGIHCATMHGLLCIQ
ncbi:hypothetical protein, partial [Escherichia coli]|uniref:hypothetical protein n=1 Tax=Escherichia coli TaxID=562 RepID=UPI00196051D1